MLGIGYWVLGVGCWVLGIVYWVLGIGYLIFGIGYWVSVIGYWVLGIGKLEGGWGLGTGGLKCCVYLSAVTTALHMVTRAVTTAMTTHQPCKHILPATLQPLQLYIATCSTTEAVDGHGAIGGPNWPTFAPAG